MLYDEKKNTIEYCWSEHTVVTKIRNCRSLGLDLIRRNDSERFFVQKRTVYRTIPSECTQSETNIFFAQIPSD